MTALDSWFDELELGAATGTRGRTVTEADVVGFAALTGDRHPQHVDAEWAASGRFGERIAHGLLVLSYAIGLVPFDPERVVALRAVREAVFKRPVRIGDTIRSEVQIGSKTELDAASGLVGCRWRVRDQRDRLVLRATIDVVWSRAPGAETAYSGHESVPR